MGQKSSRVFGLSKEVSHPNSIFGAYLDVNIMVISPQDHLLYSPKLLDLEHGTIRHRDRELANEETVRTGYFYHAQLSDWTDGKREGNSG